eukprot:5464534-Pyramimonas_sp.AAC.1
MRTSAAPRVHIGCPACAHRLRWCLPRGRKTASCDCVSFVSLPEAADRMPLYFGPRYLGTVRYRREGRTEGRGSLLTHARLVGSYPGHLPLLLVGLGSPPLISFGQPAPRLERGFLGEAASLGEVARPRELVLEC